MVTEGPSRIASDFGFQLNLAPGKTEAVVSWVGPGSRPIRRRLMALSNNRQVAMLPLKTCLDDEGDVQFSRRWQRMTERCGSRSPIAILGLWRKLELEWDERSHRVPTLDRRRGMRCHGGFWAMKDFHDICESRWPKLVWPRDVCTRRGRGASCKAIKVAWSRPWRITAGAHRLPPTGQSWKSNDEVQKELQVAELED